MTITLEWWHLFVAAGALVAAYAGGVRHAGRRTRRWCVTSSAPPRRCAGCWPPCEPLTRSRRYGAPSPRPQTGYRMAKALDTPEAILEWGKEAFGPDDCNSFSIADTERTAAYLAGAVEFTEFALEVAEKHIKGDTSVARIMENERLRRAFDETVAGVDLSKPKSQRDYSQTDGVNHYLDLQYLREAVGGEPK